MRSNKIVGFSMLELLVAVAVVGVLTAISVPMYQKYVIRTNRTAVQSAMIKISQNLATYKLVNSSYNIGLSSPTIYGGSVYPLSGVSTTYNLTLDTITVPGAWTLTAAPVGKQLNDGSVLLNDQGWQCWTKTTTPCVLSATSKW